MKIRQPAVSGRFYPEDGEELSHTIKNLFQDNPTEGPCPKALIAPHAGYIYSGPVAASIYQLLKQKKDVITRVILLGPSHYTYVNGLALSSADVFKTPLGDITIDKESIEKISHLPQVEIQDSAHQNEHSLEVHLPFLQMSLTSFKLLPLTIGNAADDEIVEVLEILCGGEETLIVVSSDLSHFHDYENANAIDRKTSEHILNLEQDQLEREMACGRIPIRGLLKFAKQLSLSPKLIDLRNSGDTAGSKDRVVGYGAFAFHESK